MRCLRQGKRHLQREGLRKRPLHLRKMQCRQVDLPPVRQEAQVTTGVAGPALLCYSVLLRCPEHSTSLGVIQQTTNLCSPGTTKGDPCQDERAMLVARRKTSTEGRSALMGTSSARAAVLAERRVPSAARSSSNENEIPVAVWFGTQEGASWISNAPLTLARPV